MDVDSSHRRGTSDGFGAYVSHDRFTKPSPKGTALEEDLALLEAWQEGEDMAGLELARRYFGMVVRFFATRLSPAAAQDLTQRTLLAYTERRGQLPPGASPQAYVMGIARKQLINHVRSCGRESRAMRLEGAAHTDTFVQSSSDLFQYSEDKKLLLLALRQLPVDSQIILELYYWENMPVQDVASVLEIPTGTVKSRLYRAREMLRARIEAMDAGYAAKRSTLDTLEAWARRTREDCIGGEKRSSSS